MTRRWWLGAVFLLMLTSVLMARQGVVKTKDGRSIQGDIDANAGGDSVSVTIHGVKTLLSKDNIAGITYADSFDQEFAARMGKLDPKDVAGRIELAKWAMGSGHFEAAREAVVSALNLDPNNAEATELERTIQSTLTMKSHTGPAPSTGQSGQPQTHQPQPVTPKRHLLSDDEINKIRQVEFQDSDAATARVSFVNDVRDRYLSRRDVDLARFNALSQGQQAIEMMKTGDANIIKDIRILNDPGSINDFRTRIQPRILVGCAASGCHGGTKGGSFFLYPDADQTALIYTNFYILQTYTAKVHGTGTGLGAGTVTRGLIDRTDPDSSLLIQFGLPATIASTPHPNVPGWKPLFLSPRDPVYKSFTQWMGRTLKPFPSDYGFKFDLPGSGGATTQPSTQPSL